MPTKTGLNVQEIHYGKALWEEIGKQFREVRRAVRLQCKFDSKRREGRLDGTVLGCGVVKKYLRQSSLSEESCEPRKGSSLVSLSHWLRAASTHHGLKMHR